MRIVVAPDKFAGSLSAPQVAAAIGEGWLSVRPDDDVVLVPLSDGGPGFIDCLAASAPGAIATVPVTGPVGGQVMARVLTGPTWYIEAAQANGLDLVAAGDRDPWRATSAGVGQLIAAAAAAGAGHAVVGLGGSATNDGGAGALGALGAVALDHHGRPVDLLGGPQSLRDVATVDLTSARATLGGMSLTIATDVDNPLLGASGASRMFALQKGAARQDLPALDAVLATWAAACVAGGADPVTAQWPGAGAAGGLGYALMLLRAHRVSGIDMVMSATGLVARCRDADMVITGEGRLDDQSLHGKVVAGVAAAANGIPVVVIAGDSRLGAAQWRAVGIDRVETLVAQAGSVPTAIARAAVLARDVAATIAADVRNP